MEDHSSSWSALLCNSCIHVSSNLYCSRDTLGGAAVKLNNYDYYLIVLTTTILFAIGIVCFYGITYYNYLAAVPGWTETTGYLQFINEMNSYLYPFLVLLLISLGLCIPKRLFEQDILIKISLLALAVTVILTYSLGMETAMGFILAVIIGLQGIVLNIDV